MEVVLGINIFEDVVKVLARAESRGRARIDKISSCREDEVGQDEVC